MLSYFVPRNCPTRREYRLVEDPFSNLIKAVLDQPLVSYNRRSSSVQFKSVEKEDRLVVYANLPHNFDKKNVKVKVYTDSEGYQWLNVKLIKEEIEGHEQGPTYSKSYSEIEKSFYIDENVYIGSKLSASLKDGDLWIVVPKRTSEEEDPNEIKIHLEEESMEKEEEDSTIPDNEDKTVTPKLEENPIQSEVEEEEETVVITDA